MDLAQQEDCASNCRESQFSRSDGEPTKCNNNHGDGSSCNSGGSRCGTPPHDNRRHANISPSQQDRLGADQKQHNQQQGVFIRGADRRALQNLRVVRRTLVYAIGLSPSFAQVNTLKQPEYFGQYGEIAKLVINHHEGVAQDDPRYGSASAYVTFRRKEDAWAAVCSVDGFRLMGRTIRASFGTTKYCNSFLRNLPCNNPDCLYLHELGDEEDRFTKDEVQLGLARHGSSFAFKEEVLGERYNAIQRPANPVFPPPCPMPPAPYQRDGMKHQREGTVKYKQGEMFYQNVKNASGACGGGHPPPPPPPSTSPSPGVCQSCGTRGGGGGRGCAGGPGAFSGASSRWLVAPTTPGSPTPLEGAGLDSDERPRRRRHRGQRGRRGAGNGSGLVGHYGDGGGSGGGGCGATAPSPHGLAMVPNEYGERVAVVPDRARRVAPPEDVFRLQDHALTPGSGLERSLHFGGGCTGDISNGVPYFDRSTASGGSSTYSGSWGKGRPPLDTPETLSNTSSLELSPLDGAARPQQELWNQSQFQHPVRPAPTFFGMRDTGPPQRGAVTRQLRQQQHYRGSCGERIEDLVAISEIQQDLFNLEQRRRHHQQEWQNGGCTDGDERASIAALQRQVEKLQRYIENSTNGGIVVRHNGGGARQTRLCPPGWDSTDSFSSDSAELSVVENQLAALSWSNSEDTATSAVGGNNITHSHQRQGFGKGPEPVHGQGEVNWEDASAEWGTATSPFDGFGSLALTSAASQAEASEWRRATPRLFT